MPIVNCNFIEEIDWQNVQQLPREIRSEIHIWRIPASAAGSTRNIHDWLNEEEFQKANRFHQHNDKLRFISSRIALKSLLGNYLGLNPLEVRIAIGVNKKPYVIHDMQKKLEFNLAHSGEWILIALSDSPVGVDLEKIDDQFSFQDIMDFSFHPSEIQFVKNEEIPRNKFYVFWTRKEAMLKATAKGLDDDLRAVPALDGMHTVGQSVLEQENNWNISSFMVDENHPGSVAYPDGANQLQFFHVASF